MVIVVGLLAGLLALSPSPLLNDKHGLIVYGHEWAFYVREPDGWTGHTERSAEIGSNVFFLQAGETLSHYGGLIRVSIHPKVDKAVDRDLADDMAKLKKVTPDIRFIDFAAHYPGGSVYAKIYRRPQGDEFVAYVDTDPKAKNYFVVSYDPPMRQLASESDLNAYRAVIRSISCCLPVLR